MYAHSHDLHLLMIGFGYWDNVVYNDHVCHLTLKQLA